MDIRIKEITYKDEIFVNQILPLYFDAFPEDERRSKEQLLDLLQNENRMKCIAIFDAVEFVGFLIFWHFDEFIYGEHFAIIDEKRNRGYASQILKDYILKHYPKFLIECELPNNTIAQRRIAFYQRMGLQLSDITYTQPAYEHNKHALPMKLMYAGMNDTEIVKAIKIIHQEVYHFS